MTSHTAKSILVMGLKAGITPEFAGWNQEAVMAAVAEQKAHLSKLNVHLDSYLVDPMLPASDHLSAVKQLLESKTFDGVSIGFGLRGNEKFTDVFTALVNLAVECGRTSEGKSPKLLFALAPDKLVDAVQMVWPEYT